MPAVTHVYDRVRAALVTELTGLTTTADRVDEDVLAVKAVTAPRLVVKVEGKVLVAHLNGIQERELNIVVTGYAKDAAGLAAVLGAIECEVEIAMAAAGTLGGLLQGDIQLKQSSRGLDYGSLEKPAGYVEIEFSSNCFTQSGSPGTSL